MGKSRRRRKRKHIQMIDQKPEDQKTPEEFADEVLGTADEQLARWYQRQIEWRRGLIATYTMEVEVLETSFEPVRNRIDERERLLAEQAEHPPSDTDPDLGKKLAALPGGVTGLIDVERTKDGETIIKDPNATQAFEVPDEESGQTYG